MDNNFELVICIDREAKTKEILRTGTIEEIDRFTKNFENGNEIKALYSKKVKDFYEKNKSHIDTITRKNGKKETGDIAIIGTINKESRRIKVLYKKHIEMFEKIKEYENIIKFGKFEQYLRDNYYKEYCQLQMFKNLFKHLFKNKEENADDNIEIPEEIKEEMLFLIRKVYDLYKVYSKERNEISPDRIYTEIKKRQKSKENKQELELQEAYEKVFKEERNEERKYNIQETKGRQKIKKISGGN